MENAGRNGVGDGLVYMPTGGSMFPLPAGEAADLVIWNPAQLSLPEADRADNPFYAGKDGRLMIEGVIRETPGRLSPAGRLLMTHNSLTDWPASARLMETHGLEPRVLAQRTLEFRPFVDRAGLDELAGTARGLYTVCDGRADETLYVVEAHLRGAAGAKRS